LFVFSLNFIWVILCVRKLDHKKPFGSALW
jgi:hypothetical protein